MKDKESRNCVLYMSTFPPRECGIATFTKDLVDSMDKKFNPALKSEVLAINDNGSSIYNYDGKVSFQLDQTDMEGYIRTAKEINDRKDIKIVNVQHEFGIFGGNAGYHLLPFLEKAPGKKIIAFNKSDLLSDSEKRKIDATLKSKKYNFCIISAKTFEGIEELKQKLLKNSGVIRVYTKQPGMPADRNPMLMKPNSTIKDAAEKILHGFSSKIKEVRITGPSSKFPNQKVGLGHVLKDKDIVEFRTE